MKKKVKIKNGIIEFFGIFIFKVNLQFFNFEESVFRDGNFDGDKEKNEERKKEELEEEKRDEKVLKNYVEQE